MEQTPGQPPQAAPTESSEVAKVDVSQGLNFEFQGSGTDLGILILKNIILSILTLGIYFAWAKVNLRKFIWQNTTLNDDNFVYTGTGKELFFGYLKLALFYGLFVGIAQGLEYVQEGLGGIIFLLILPIYPYAMFASQRYRLSRTTYRSIRMGMLPRHKAFIKEFLLGYLIVIVTLGIYTPWWLEKLYSIRINSCFYGNAQFKYTGTATDAATIFWKWFIPIVLTMGICFYFYRAELIQYRSKNTWIGSADLGAVRAHSDVSGVELLGIGILNSFFTTLTLGLAGPWVIAFTFTYLLKKFSLKGQVNFDDVQQIESEGSETGDSFADVWDVGIGV